LGFIVHASCFRLLWRRNQSLYERGIRKLFATLLEEEIDSRFTILGLSSGLWQQLGADPGAGCRKRTYGEIKRQESSHRTEESVEPFPVRTLDVSPTPENLNLRDNLAHERVDINDANEIVAATQVGLVLVVAPGWPAAALLAGVRNAGVAVCEVRFMNV
jgi:hypothetical protein